LARGSRVELGILDADGHTRADQCQQAPMFFGEVSGFARLQIDHANHAILHDQRNGKLGAYVRNGLDIAVFLGDVLDQHGLPELRGAPGDPLAYFDSDPVGIFSGIARLETEAQLLSLLVEQKDGENFVIDDLANEFRHPPEGGVEVERGIDHVGDFQQQWVDFQLEIRFGGDGVHD
jgi:hypothetical protein